MRTQAFFDYLSSFSGDQRHLVRLSGLGDIHRHYDDRALARTPPHHPPSPLARARARARVCHAPPNSRPGELCSSRWLCFGVGVNRALSASADFIPAARARGLQPRLGEQVPPPPTHTLPPWHEARNDDVTAPCVMTRCSELRQS